jgi:hypothetical protein
MRIVRAAIGFVIGGILSAACVASQERPSQLRPDGRLSAAETAAAAKACQVDPARLRLQSVSGVLGMNVALVARTREGVEERHRVYRCLGEWSQTQGFGAITLELPSNKSGKQ